MVLSAQTQEMIRPEKKMKCAGVMLLGGASPNMDGIIHLGYPFMFATSWGSPNFLPASVSYKTGLTRLKSGRMPDILSTYWVRLHLMPFLAIASERSSCHSLFSIGAGFLSAMEKYA
jgi:hypothetical protein